MSDALVRNGFDIFQPASRISNVLRHADNNVGVAKKIRKNASSRNENSEVDYKK